jgi:hypothetical protein
MLTSSKPYPSVSRPLASYVISLLLVLSAIGLPGCTRSLRQDGTKIAQAGSTVAKQMAEYYGTLQLDTNNTYELNAFREAYLLQKAYDREVERAKEQNQPAPPPPSFDMSDTDKLIFQEYLKTYQALAARVRLAKAMQNAYDSYAQLSAYDSTQEVLDSLDGLVKTVSAASNLVLPDPTGTVTSLVQGLFKDIITEITTIQQNRKLLLESNRLIPILQKLKQVFDAERVLYGGDAEVTDSQGVKRAVSGIAGRRAAAYKSVARQLVEGDAVITTAMVNRVLSVYQFRWPEPQVPFTQPALKAGIVKIIESRAYPLMQLSEDVGEGLSKSLSTLIAQHQKLAVRKPMSVQELFEHSATVQVLIDQLKSQGVPTGLLTQLITASEKGTQQ